MFVRLGIWHDYVALYLRYRNPRPLCVWLERRADGGRRLVVEEDLEGHFAVRDHADGETTTAYPYRVSMPRDPADDLTRCRLMEVHMAPMDYGRFGPTLWHADLPLDHELPWPKVRDCKAYRQLNELMGECERRCESARTHGVRAPAPPPDVQLLLTREMRVALFR